MACLWKGGDSFNCLPLEWTGVGACGPRNAKNQTVLEEYYGIVYSARTKQITTTIKLLPQEPTTSSMIAVSPIRILPSGLYVIPRSIPYPLWYVLLKDTILIRYPIMWLSMLPSVYTASGCITKTWEIQSNTNLGKNNEKNEVREYDLDTVTASRFWNLKMFETP